jgi:arsenate reductase
MAWRRSTEIRRRLRAAYVAGERDAFDRRPRVVFVCVENSARSQMAEGLLRALAGDRFEVRSGGLVPTRVHPFAIIVMKERGIDISGQRAKSVDELGSVGSSTIITLCDDAAEACPMISGEAERLHWSFPDPAAAEGDGHERLAAFRATRDAIERRISGWVASLGERDAMVASH